MNGSIYQWIISRVFWSIMVSLTDLDKIPPSKEYKYVTLLEHYKTTRGADFSVDFRPCQERKVSGHLGQPTNRIWPEDLWTGMKKIQVRANWIYGLKNVAEIEKTLQQKALENLWNSPLCRIQLTFRFEFQLNSKDIHDLKEHHDIQRERKPPDMYQVCIGKNPSFWAAEQGHLVEI